jgi:hypothetical protein
MSDLEFEAAEQLVGDRSPECPSDESRPSYPCNVLEGEFAASGEVKRCGNAPSDHRREFGLANRAFHEFKERLDHPVLMAATYGVPADRPPDHDRDRSFRLRQPQSLAPHSLREWAKIYRCRGWAIVPIRAGEKRPTARLWTRHSFEPEDFDDTDSIGIQSGCLSGNLVCIDLDDMLAVELADTYLPETGLVEGRPGKPRSHRWYKVTNIPSELTAPSTVAGGLGGPRTRQFRKPDGKVIVEFRGTGSQAVAPPSMWQKGNCQERREWHAFGEAATLPCQTLFEAVSRLAAACGWVDKEKTRPQSKEKTAVEMPPPEMLPLPTTEAARRVRKYLAAMEPAVTGNGGDPKMFQAACVAIEFGLSDQDAMALLLEYNLRCQPPFSLVQLQHKIQQAMAKVGNRKGERLKLVGKPKSDKKMVVNFIPGEATIYVGVGVAKKQTSHIEFTRSLHAGLCGYGRSLANQLEDIDWNGKEVVLCPASTITTNKGEVWNEYHLARLLRRKGARVWTIRLPDDNGLGRRCTLADGGWDGELKEPPTNRQDAELMAGHASMLAREVKGKRLKLPRHTAKPARDAASAFIRLHGVTSLSKEVLALAKEVGLSRSTLRRALSTMTSSRAA